MLKTIFMGLFSLSLLAAQSQTPHRISGSPYPTSQIPDTLYAISAYGWSEAMRLTSLTLQGLLAKTEAKIYNESNVGYPVWIKDLVAYYGVHRDDSYYNNFAGLLTKFSKGIEGYILCNLHDNSTNVAISMCGLFNTVAVTSENVDLMINLGIPLYMDVTDKDEEWLLTNYGSEFNRDIVSFQHEDKSLFLGDYTIFSSAFQFFDDLNSNLTANAFDRMNDNSVLFGWGADELHTVEKASSYSIQVHPADWTENISALSNFNATTVQHTHTTAVNNEDNVHTVCFLMSDGDNYDWLLKEFATDEKWYGSLNRGEVSIGWTVSPAMCELAPTILKYLYDSAANNTIAKDFFVGSSSGLGYMYPNEFPNLQASTDLLNNYMEKSDLNIINIIGTNYNDAYMAPYLQQSNIDAVFYYNYDNYSGLGGNIYWLNNKPVIGARYNFWEGFETVQSLAAKLNKLPADANSESAYSLIAVHAWTRTVDDIIACTKLLDDDVIVVTPDEFVKRIQSKMGPNSLQNNLHGSNFNIYPNPASNGSIHINGDLRTNDIIEITGLDSKVIYKETVKNNQKDYQIKLNDNTSEGLYIVVISRDSEATSKKIIVENIN